MLNKIENKALLIEQKQKIKDRISKLIVKNKLTTKDLLELDKSAGALIYREVGVGSGSFSLQKYKRIEELIKQKVANK